MHAVIVGNGVAGVQAAIRLRELQPEWKITIVSGESTFHYSRPALMYVFMRHMRYQDTKPFPDDFWPRHKIGLVRDWVMSIDSGGRRLTLHRGDDLHYDRLLIATGSKSNKFGWLGQDLDGVQGLYDLMDLDLLYRNVEKARSAVIVGGGLIGIELGEMLHWRGLDVTFLVREQSYWNNVLPAEESSMVNERIRAAGMNLILGTNLKEIVDDGHGRCCAVVTEFDERIDCGIVGLTAGVSPNLDLARSSGLDCDRGILVDDSFATSADDVFAAGDCAEIRRPGQKRSLIQQVWYTGKTQGRLAGEAMAGREVSYEPGTWYNSAKFLDLEYQTYGDVGSKAPGGQNLVWQDAEKQHCLRIVHIDGRVIGINLMGLRYRHRVCERWISERREVAYVLEHLAEANFDPEFFARHEDDIARDLREQYGLAEGTKA